MRDKAEDEKSYLTKQHQNPSPEPTTTVAPPSPSSSPTHEFSFTVSLRPHPPPNSVQEHNAKTSNTINNHKTNTTTPAAIDSSPAAIDLSPADDIFFHGHLLPLHFLSNLPVSPRTSTNSLDSFTLPIKDLYDQTNPIGNTSFHCHHQTTLSDFDAQGTTFNQERPKSKSFSIFGKPKSKKGCHDERERDEDQDRERNNNHKKLKLDLTQLIKRYMKMVRPLLSFPKSRRSNTTIHRQSYSFSSNVLSSRRSSRPVEMSTGGKFSAPASMRTSPANSGILLASGTISPAKSTASDSTMEELHAAIQAAIAHCKNSVAMEDTIQCKN